MKRKRPKARRTRWPGVLAAALLILLGLGMLLSRSTVPRRAVRPASPEATPTATPLVATPTPSAADDETDEP